MKTLLIFILTIISIKSFCNEQASLVGYWEGKNTQNFCVSTSVLESCLTNPPIRELSKIRYEFKADSTYTLWHITGENNQKSDNRWKHVNKNTYLFETFTGKYYAEITVSNDLLKLCFHSESVCETLKKVTDPQQLKTGQHEVPESNEVSFSWHINGQTYKGKGQFYFNNDYNRLQESVTVFRVIAEDTEYIAEVTTYLFKEDPSLVSSYGIMVNLFNIENNHGNILLLSKEPQYISPENSAVFPAYAGKNKIKFSVSLP